MGEQAPPTPLGALLHVTEFQFGSNISRAVTLLDTTVKQAVPVPVKSMNEIILPFTDFLEMFGWKILHFRDHVKQTQPNN